MERKIEQQINGHRTVDGAGVNLVRVLGYQTVKEYDPILMLDSFDSVNPEEYTAGFPMHPHRGIETISYVFHGHMTHRDSLGNEDTIGDGEVQWMTAGSGILHEEMIPPVVRLLGVQLWLNLPAKDKMVPPAYKSIKNSEIKEIKLEQGKLRLLAGHYEGHAGFQSHYLPLDYYDVHIEPDGKVTLPTQSDHTVILFTLSGDAYVGGVLVREKTAVKLTRGEKVTIGATCEASQVLFISSTALDESIVWGGPIVMNTKEELQKAFDDLDHGTFLKQDMRYEK